MRTHYVLIDYENVQPQSLASLSEAHFKVVLFVGASQPKLAFEIADAMQRLGDRAQYIQISGNGPNALDFHIAFYVGHIAATDANACFHIISKDAGFDPLIRHLKAKNISVVRSKAIADIPSPDAGKGDDLSERVALVVANLKQRKPSPPRTLKTLSSSVASLFQNRLTGDESLALVSELRRLGFVLVDGNKVSYALPGEEAAKGGTA